jgi:pimeloyl-ACP methyl ester carboxylesterase
MWTTPRDHLAQGIVIIGAVLGALLPGARDQLSSAAEEYLRVIRYLWVAATRNNLRGEVLTLIERVSERPEIDGIHIVGHSFGSIVAVNWIERSPSSASNSTQGSRHRAIS